MGEKQMWKRLIAEFIGTFLFVLIGAGAVAYFASRTTEYTINTALAFGGIMIVIAYLFGCLSGGHVNPAVSLGVALVGRMSWGDMLLYWIVQILGGLLAAALIYWIFGSANNAGASIGSLTFENAWKAVAVEALITMILVLGFLCLSKNWKLSLVSGLALGAILTINFIFAGNLTGASANPARSFGPALFSGNMGTFWIYLVGPLIGAIVAAIVYSIFHYSSYSPALDANGNPMMTQCCDPIVEKEVQAKDNCGNKIVDKNGCPVMYKKRKIDTSKGSYKFGDKKDKLKAKLGQSKHTTKLFADAFLSPSAEELQQVGPTSNALMKDLPYKEALGYDHQHVKDKEEVKQLQAPVIQVQQTQGQVVPKKELSTQFPDKNSSKVSSLLSAQQVKVPFNSPTSLSRAMSGVGAQI